MCGIVAYVGVGAIPEAVDAVRSISAGLEHRGPDDHGLLVWAPSQGIAYTEDGRGERAALGSPDPTGDPFTVVLAARRLAILDTTDAGHQPMLDEQGTCALVMNGEIYNHVELRAELTAAGHRFRSRSDTEVVLAAYREWGRSCLERLVGMFAFAICDLHERSLLVARDRFGMKPLFQARACGGWLFASEMGALLDGADLSRRVNPQTVVDYLATGRTGASTESVFAAISQVPPASSIACSSSDLDDLSSRRYWDPDLSQTLDISFAEAARRVREEVVRSVELHLRSDVPVGVMLSGGTDSSTIAAAMREIAGSALDIHTFSYVGEHGATSEEPWIDAVNARIAAEPHKLRLTPHEWAAAERRAFHQGEPSASLAVYAQGRLYELAARAGIRVGLSGQGGDEVFAGYANYWPARLTALLSRGRIREACGFVARTGRNRASHDPTRAGLVLRALQPYVPHGIRTRTRERRYTRPWIDPDYCTRNGVGIPSGVWPSGKHALRRTLLRAQQDGLQSLLRYEDRNSMEHSVEGRLPFVTAPLVELVLQLPDDYLIAPDGTTKWVLKEAMRGLVPDVVLDRRDRIGFDVPLRSWPAMIPEMNVLLGKALDLPPVRGAAMTHLLDRLGPGQRLSPTDAFALWRLVGLGDWAADLGAEFD